MFFPRLRRHAKWMFLFLALALGLGFVLFGIGAGGIGLGNLAEGGAGSGVPSVSDSEQRVLDNPKDAQAFKDLATAHQAEGDTDEAVEAMTSYVALKPKDADGLRELAALYLQQASTAQERAQIYQVRSDYLAPGSIRDTVFQLGGSPLAPDPITNALSTSYDQQIRLQYRRSRRRRRRPSSSTGRSPCSSRRIPRCSSSSPRPRSRRTTRQP